MLLGAATFPQASAPTTLRTAVSLLADESFVLGGSGVPTPSQGYAEAADTLYLTPDGFTGTATPFTTPEILGNGEGLLSEAEGASLVARAIEEGVTAGTITPEHPAYVFGYSQSSAMSTLTMDWLCGRSNEIVTQWANTQNGGFTQPVADPPVPSQDVHFVLVGDSAAPNGGIVNVLNTPQTDWLGQLDGLPFGNPTPNDLYPTDVYNLEYDGWADFPMYAGNLTADVNAIDGMFLEHLAYLGLTQTQIDAADVVQDGSVTYHYIPVQVLPGLASWLQFGTLGRAVYDLLEPETQVQVDLGYGHLDLGPGGKLDLDMDGFNPGGPETLNTVDFGSPGFSQEQIDSAMSQAWALGWDHFEADLSDPASITPLPNPYDTLLDAGLATGAIAPWEASILESLGW